MGSPIFREKAMQNYLRGRDRVVLPSFVAPPVFLLFWSLLFIFMSAGVVAWLGQVPLYVDGTGVLLKTHAVVFIPRTSALRIQVGQPVQMQLGENEFSGIVAVIDPHLFSPAEVRKQFMFGITEPAQAVTVSFGSHLVTHLYDGSSVSARVQVGSRRLLSLFPGCDALLRAVKMDM